MCAWTPRLCHVWNIWTFAEEMMLMLSILNAILKTMTICLWIWCACEGALPGVYWKEKLLCLAEMVALEQRVLFSVFLRVKKITSLPGSLDLEPLTVSSTPPYGICLPLLLNFFVFYLLPPLSNSVTQGPSSAEEFEERSKSSHSSVLFSSQVSHLPWSGSLFIAAVSALFQTHRCFLNIRAAAVLPVNLTSNIYEPLPSKVNV